MTKTIANILISIVLTLSVFLIVIAVDLLISGGVLCMFLSQLLNPGH